MWSLVRIIFMLSTFKITLKKIRGNNYLVLVHFEARFDLRAHTRLHFSKFYNLINQMA